MRSIQAPTAVVMIRPHCFTSNPDTMADNAFQQRSLSQSAQDVAKRAFDEVTQMVDTLQAHGVTVHLFEDTGTQTPDSVFPNNWFSTHAGGHIAVYPMATPSRQKERRWDVIELLKRHYRVQDVIDYSGLEPDNVFFEGTGAMVLDHMERVAYAVRSKRTDPVALERFCTHFNFEPMVFDAASTNGQAIYHTNVLMCIGTQIALAGMELITDQHRRAQIQERLTENGRELIVLSAQQIDEFAGNALELQTKTHRVLAISSRAVRSLSHEQKARIEQYVQIVPLDVPTIEQAGGSVRCMLAGIHLAQRT